MPIRHADRHPGSAPRADRDDEEKDVLGELEGGGLAAARPAYSAPALEKGLDILELLAEERLPLTMRQIGDRLGRSKNELFRMIMVLLSRGYIAREERTDAFVLTQRLFA